MRLINADAFKREITAYAVANNIAPNKALALCKIIDKQPAVDSEPARHGKWILEREPDGTPYCFHCSVCDDDFHHIGIKTKYKYCPNCGAKMDGDAQ